MPRAVASHPKCEACSTAPIESRTRRCGSCSKRAKTEDQAREELIANTSITDQDLKESEDYGLIKVLADKRHYDDIAVKTARVIAALSGFGLEPRHLKFLKSGSDRESSLIKQVASPMSRSKRPDAGEQALEMMREISNLTNQLHFILVSSTLDEEIL